MNPAPPLATWRAQFTPDWRFEHAEAIVPYLHELGISDLYASPILEARAGSTHGYDVTDPTRIRGELGGETGFRTLTARLRERGMGIILDIVPNHMAADHGNPWWWDVLKHGPASRAAAFFDIDWAAAGGKVILPVLGKSLEDCLSAGEITVGNAPRGDEPALCYHDRRFPLSPESLADFPRDPRQSQGRTALHRLVDRQHYRPMFWRDGLRAINYRRFFDIPDLVSLRAEDAAVFEEAHRLILELLSSGEIRGLRIDHIDGLFDPRQYLGRLREHMPSGYLIVEKILAHDEHIPRDWPIDGASGYEFLAAINPLFVDPRGVGMIEADAQARLDAAPAFEGAAREARRFVIRQLFQAETDRLIRSLAEIASAANQAIPPDHLRQALTETTAAMEVYRTYIAGGAVHADDRRRIEHALDTAAAYALDSDAPWNTALALLRRILIADPAPLPAAAAQLAREFIRRWQQYTGPVMAKGVEDTALYRRITLASLNDVGCDPDQLPADPCTAFHQFCIDRAAASSRSLNATATHDTKRGEDTRLRIHVLASMPSEYLEALDRWSIWHQPLCTAFESGPAPRPADEALIYQSLLGIWPAEASAASHTLDEDIASRLAEYMIKAAREAKLRSNWHTPDERYEESLRRFIHALVLGPEGAPFREDSRILRERMMTAAAAHSIAQVVLKCFTPGIPDFYRGTELWDLSLVDPDNRRPVDFERRTTILAELRRRTSAATSAAAHRELLDELMADTGPLGWRTGAIKLFTIWQSLTFRRQHAELLTRGEYIPLTLTGAYAKNLFACARRLHMPAGDSWAIAIVPRLVGRLPGRFPRGEAWGDAAVLLPPGAPTRWHNRFNPDQAASAAVKGSCDPARLQASTFLRDFPVGLLAPPTP
jgi:(1->4)-alpha-D-glucan 1-alpha-D-glucosylmutase